VNGQTDDRGAGYAADQGAVALDAEQANEEMQRGARQIAKEVEREA